MYKRQPYDIKYNDKQLDGMDEAAADTLKQVIQTYIDKNGLNSNIKISCYIMKDVYKRQESIYESDNDTGYFYITFDGNYIWMDDEGYKNMAMYFNKQSSSLGYTLYQLSLIHIYYQLHI